MNTEFIVEKGRPEHLDAIMEIENACFAEDSFSRRQISYLISKAQGSCYVICKNKNVVAYVSFVYRSNASNLRMYSLAVHPLARRLNLGQMLMDTSIGYAVEHNYKSVTLEVDTKNKAAIALYTKNGFKYTSIKKGYYHNGDAYCMKKELVTPHS
ncbi:MAG: ribosomal protein S18-alanine N-acetyltransferase [Bacteroidales bacterium]